MASEAADVGTRDLRALLMRAATIAGFKSTKAPQRTLIQEMCVALVSLATLNASLAQAVEEQPRIVLP